MTRAAPLCNEETFSVFLLRKSDYGRPWANYFQRQHDITRLRDFRIVGFGISQEKTYKTAIDFDRPRAWFRELYFCPIFTRAAGRLGRESQTVMIGIGGEDHRFQP